MTDEQQRRCDDLWRELLAAGQVRWMPGMLARADGWADLRLAVEFLPFVWSGIAGDVVGHDHAHNVGDDALPVWTDPATLGCLLATAREAVGHSAISVWRSTMTCEWGVYHTDRPQFCATEAEALLLAIREAHQ